jgi:hypothetical protein
MKSSSRPGVLRYPRDAWPVGLITAGLILSLVGLSYAPGTAEYWALLVLSLPLRALASVHHHCHAHLATFRWRPLNVAYDQVLTLLSGYTTPGWALQHCWAHHRYFLDPTRDPASPTRFGRGRGRRLRFTVAGDACSWFDAWRFAREAERMSGWRDIRRRLVLHTLAQVVLTLALVALAPIGALIAFVGVNRLIRWSVFWFSYSQHADLPATTVYDGARTHLWRGNRWLLNVGHHTAHHERPTLHWSLLPRRTHAILTKIDPVCVEMGR